MYTTKHAKKLYDVKSDQTIRNWVKEYQEFFSIDAAPGKGIDLVFTEEDMRVLDLISSMRSDRRPSDEIYATLKSGQRGETPEQTPEELNLLVSGEYEKYLSTQREELSLKVDQLTRENEELRAAIQPIRDKNIQLEAERHALERQIQELKNQLQSQLTHSERLVEQERTRGQEQIERGQGQIQNLLREIAELRYKMGLMEKRDDQEK